MKITERARSLQRKKANSTQYIRNKQANFEILFKQGIDKIEIMQVLGVSEAQYNVMMHRFKKKLLKDVEINNILNFGDDKLKKEIKANALNSINEIIKKAGAIKSEDLVANMFNKIMD